MVMFKNYFIAIFLVVLSVISFKIRAMEGSPDSEKLNSEPILLLILSASLYY
jgi:hypothetical protein